MSGRHRAQQDNGRPDGAHTGAREACGHGHGQGHDQNHEQGHAHDHDQGREQNHERGHAHDHEQGQEQSHEPGRDHDQGHGHGQHHGHHHHHHVPPNGGKAFGIAVILNVLYVGVEFGYGFVAHSTALMADAGHNLSDVLALLLAWGAMTLARIRPFGGFSYGLRNTSIMAAVINAALLLATCGGIAWAALLRLAHPSEVAGWTVFIVSLAGVAVNGLSAWLFVAGSKGDLNVRGAFVHMAADAVISLGVAVSGIVILFTGWNRLDPIVSLVVVAIIVAGTWRLLRDSVRLALAGVPPNIDECAVSAYLGALPGVAEVHDLHIWALSTTENCLTVHLVMPDGHPGDMFIDRVVHTLGHDYAIDHVTVQVDIETGRHQCALRQ